MCEIIKGSVELKNLPIRSFENKTPQDYAREITYKGIKAV